MKSLAGSVPDKAARSKGKNRFASKNLAAINTVLQKSLASPHTDDGQLPEIRDELKILKRIDKLFKPRKIKNWYFLKIMPQPPEPRDPKIGETMDAK